MSVEITLVIGLIGCISTIVGIVSFIIGQKKSGKDDGMSLRYFYAVK